MEIEKEAQQEFIDRALKDAEADERPKKQGRFEKYDLAVNDDDQRDADEANANQQV